MKTLIFLYCLTLAATSCKGSGENNNTGDKNKIIYKQHSKSSLQDTDTLWVSQNDTAVFSAEEKIQRYPDRNAELVMHYTLRHPQEGAYYFIYNDLQQLVQEGIYTAQYEYKGEILEGGFFNSKMYTYKNNGALSNIYYQEDGRNLKQELYDKDRQLKKVIYYNKKSGDKEKVAIYKKGKLKETLIYTGFDTYHTVKAEQ